MPETDIITQFGGQFAGLGLFAFLVWKTFSEALKKIVASLEKIGEVMTKHGESLTLLNERIGNIDRMLEDRMLDSQRAKRKREETKHGL